jgi:hypothetical protein
MGMPQCNHANGRVIGELQMRSFIFNLTSLLLILNVSTPHQPPPTMAITTRSAIPKEKPISQALMAIADTPVERHHD